MRTVIDLKAMDNKKIIEKMIEEFSKKNNDFNFDFLDENMKWNIVGMPTISGRNEFLNAIKNLQLENCADNNIKKIIAEGDFVVVESSGKNIGPAYCDIYFLKLGKIKELTTYIVDTSLNNETNLQQ